VLVKLYITQNHIFLQLFLKLLFIYVISDKFIGPTYKKVT